LVVDCRMIWNELISRPRLLHLDKLNMFQEFNYFENKTEISCHRKVCMKEWHPFRVYKNDALAPGYVTIHNSLWLKSLNSESCILIVVFVSNRKIQFICCECAEVTCCITMFCYFLVLYVPCIRVQEIGCAVWIEIKYVF
jgi:hypothetical protein